MSSSMRKSNTNVSGTKKSDESGGSLKSKLGLLEKDLERRQESYISRERAYKSRIEELEGEVLSVREQRTGWMKADAKMLKLKKMQGAIMTNVELVQDRTARILQEQERDLLRAFRARLYDVQTELEKEKSKKDDGASAWMERTRQLSSELEWAKEVADRLERVNHALTQENKRLKGQFRSQEEDRDFLIKQLVGVKKDNARLRNEYTEMEKDNQRIAEELSKAETGRNRGSATPGRGGAAAATASAGDGDEKLRDVNKRLRRLLADERRALQLVRNNYAEELKARTELEMLLRSCVEDIRKEIARRHVEQAKFTNNVAVQDLANLYAKNPGDIPMEEFMQEDRERAMELLLSQERVVTLLYAKTFPVKAKPGGVALEGGGNAGGSEDMEGAVLAAMADRPLTAGAAGPEDQVSAVGSTKLPGIRSGAKSNLE